jgi:IS5 family transposase
MTNNEVKEQSTLFGISLDLLCDKRQSLYRLADTIDWDVFEEHFGPSYCEENGRPAKPIRLMVGLHYLKFTFNESDELIVEKWVQNPYWQYFCGEKEFQHEFPIDPTSMGKWRKRIKENGLEKLLKETIRAGLKIGAVKPHQFKKVIVDTTVQEKAIAFPTDSKLYHRMREKLVKKAKELGIELRQTYTRKSKKALFKQGRYRHAKQMKRANREVRKLKTYFGRVLRDIERKTKDQGEKEKVSDLLNLAYRLYYQKRNDKNKLYSLHAPEVECISKGKAHKRYEFGCKASYVTSNKGNFIIGAKAFHNNPYDGHTLDPALKQASKLIEGLGRIKSAFVDKGYKGASVDGIEIIGANRRKISNSRGNCKTIKFLV